MEITNYCLSCICKAVTGCIRSERTKCYNSDTLCGSFKFGEGFWIDAGKCTKSPDDDPNDPEGLERTFIKNFESWKKCLFSAWKNCAQDFDCAAKTVKAYMAYAIKLGKGGMYESS